MINRKRACFLTLMFGVSLLISACGEESVDQNDLISLQGKGDDSLTENQKSYKNMLTNKQLKLANTSFILNIYDNGFNVVWSMGDKDADGEFSYYGVYHFIDSKTYTDNKSTCWSKLQKYPDIKEILFLDRTYFKGDGTVTENIGILGLGIVDGKMKILKIKTPTTNDCSKQPLPLGCSSSCDDSDRWQNALDWLNK